MNNNKKNRIKSINPASEQVIQEYNIINEEEMSE
jgi:hypothetical protein